MNITPTVLAAEVHAFDLRYPGVVAAAETKHSLPKHLLHALGSRETDLAPYYETHAGFGGHDWGLWQLNDQSHTVPSPFPVTQQADIAAGMLHSLIGHFGGNIKSACSAYNAGTGGAENGLAQGDSDLFTTHHDYGSDVVARMQSLATFVPVPAPAPTPTPAPAPAMPTLREGSTGTAVKTLQSALHITVDGSFGPMTKAAVIRFQQAHNLTADGIVGPLTWHALGH